MNLYKNQNVDIIKEDLNYKIISKQNRSSPGIFIYYTFEPNTNYNIIIRGKVQDNYKKPVILWILNINNNKFILKSIDYKLNNGDITYLLQNGIGRYTAKVGLMFFEPNIGDFFYVYSIQITNISDNIQNKINNKKLNKNLITIIMPTLNRGVKCTNVIDMILNQTYKNIELIIIDDGSTIKNSEIITEKINGLKDNRIKYNKNETNLGISKSLNKGINLSSGEYVTWISDDNIYYNNFIEELYNPEYDFTYSAYEHQYIDGIIKKIECKYNNIHSIIYDFLGCVGFMWSKKFMNYIKNYNELLYGVEDLDYLLRTFYYTNNIKYINIPLVKYISHHDSLYIKDNKHIINLKNKLDTIYKLFLNNLINKEYYIISVIDNINKYDCGKIIITNEIKYKNDILYIPKEYIEVILNLLLNKKKILININNELDNNVLNSKYKDLYILNYNNTDTINIELNNLII